MELVAQGIELAKVGEYDNLFRDGGRGELKLYLDTELPDTTIAYLETELTRNEIEMWDSVRQVARTVYVRFIWKPMMVATTPGGATIGTLYVIANVTSSCGIHPTAWQLFKETGGRIGLWLLGGFGLLALILLRRGRR